MEACAEAGLPMPDLGPNLKTNIIIITKTKSHAKGAKPKHNFCQTDFPRRDFEAERRHQDSSKISSLAGTAHARLYDARTSHQGAEARLMDFALTLTVVAEGRCQHRPVSGHGAHSAGRRDGQWPRADG